MSCSQLTGIEGAVALDQEPAEQRRLLGVVGHRSGGHARGDRMTGRRGLEAAQHGPPALPYLRPRQQLRRHPQCVADRQPVQRTPGARGVFHERP
jgi:hypothetical protein